MASGFVTDFVAKLHLRRIQRSPTMCSEVGLQTSLHVANFNEAFRRTRGSDGRLHMFEMLKLTSFQGESLSGVSALTDSAGEGRGGRVRTMVRVLPPDSMFRVRFLSSMCENFSCHCRISIGLLMFRCWAL